MRRCFVPFIILTGPSMKHKRTTPPLKKEMLAVVYSCDKFRSYIIGSKVIVHTMLEKSSKGNRP